VKYIPFAVLAAVCFLAGCATSISPVGPNFTGNWQLTGTSTQYPSPYATGHIGIYLTQSGSTVSGIAWEQDAFPNVCGIVTPSCEIPFEFVSGPMAGTVDADGRMVLSTTSPPPGIPTLTISATTNGSILSVSYTITGLQYPDQGTMSGVLIAPVKGTYAGTVVSAYTGLSMGVTTTLNQTAGPDAFGELELTGPATFTGAPCFTTAVNQGPAATPSGYVLGRIFEVGLVSSSNSSIYVSEAGTVSPDAKTIDFHYGVVNLSGNGCSKDDYGSGTLTLQ
jgi:hypothetical protein